LLLAHRLGRRVEHEIDALHVLMGVALAGMLVRGLDPWNGTVWTGVFAATTLWLTGHAVLAWRLSDPGGRTPALRRHLPHLVLSGAMLYMYLAASGSAAGPGGTGGGAGMAAGAASAARYPTAALPLALFLCGYAVTVVDRTPLRSAPATARRAADTPTTTSPGGPGITPAPPPLAPRGANCCDIVMSLTMALLLITLL
jgi:hypothetical protein